MTAMFVNDLTPGTSTYSVSSDDAKVYFSSVGNKIIATDVEQIQDFLFINDLRSKNVSKGVRVFKMRFCLKLPGPL